MSTTRTTSVPFSALVMGSVCCRRMRCTASKNLRLVCSRGRPRRARPNGLTSRGTGHLPTATSNYERLVSPFWSPASGQIRAPLRLGSRGQLRWSWATRCGCSAEARDMADGAVQIPMVGMVESLNVSVACAVCLYEAFRQRTVAGHYELPKSTRIVCALEEDWLRRES